MKALALTLAIGGTLLICAGSAIGMLAPGDGQTGMIVFPAWLLGGMAGLVALLLVLFDRGARPAWGIVAICAIVAFSSVAGVFQASEAYERERGARQRPLAEL
ncbi:MAG: hypothetical protein ACO1SV_21305 [Fimbriimonas sp.]